jgi:hypothetical protein
LRADKLRQHLIQIVDHRLQKLLCGRDCTTDRATSLKTRPSFRKKIASKGTRKTSQAFFAVALGARKPKRSAYFLMSSNFAGGCRGAFPAWCCSAVFLPDVVGDYPELTG